jgi:hypothetical protein
VIADRGLRIGGHPGLLSAFSICSLLDSHSFFHHPQPLPPRLRIVRASRSPSAEWGLRIAESGFRPRPARVSARTPQRTPDLGLGSSLLRSAPTECSGTARKSDPRPDQSEARYTPEMGVAGEQRRVHGKYGRSDPDVVLRNGSALAEEVRSQATVGIGDA